jgi:hypothetical protein
MDTQPDKLTRPSPSRIEVSISASADVHITAAAARRRVSRLVISEIGNLLCGGEPSLVVSERICWRVPILLAFPDTGPVGQVGALDVDVETGEVSVTPERLGEIDEYAQYLARRTSSVASGKETAR